MRMYVCVCIFKKAKVWIYITLYYSHSFKKAEWIDQNVNNGYMWEVRLRFIFNFMLFIFLYHNNFLNEYALTL